MRVLIVTKIFPNGRHPTEAPFNRQQFVALAERCEVRVWATLPWFPGARLWSRWEDSHGVPPNERLFGMMVEHPRTLYVPKLDRGWNGTLYAASLLAPLWPQRHWPDVILGSYAYPDGVGAIQLGKWLGCPAVVKVHGDDINTLGFRPGSGKALRKALPKAARVVAVSQALAEKVRELGVAEKRVDIVPNGVDSNIFYPRSRMEARMRLGVPPERRLVLYVGHLLAEKGLLDLLLAFEKLAERHPLLDLAIIGQGADGAKGKKQLERYAKRIRWLGALPSQEVAWWMGACDLLALPSYREGTPNVVLEALACGRKVIASSVGGIPDVLRSAELGVLVPPAEPLALSEAIVGSLYQAYDPETVRARAPLVSWEQSAETLYQSLQRAVQKS